MAQYTIEDVKVESVSKGKATWNVANVIYDNKGERKEKKVVSFSNPEVFKTVSELKAGDVIDVSFVKDDKYFNWASIQKLGTTADTPKPTGGKVVGSNYETKEERAARQRLIVRQNALTNAVSFINQAKDRQDYSRVDVTNIAEYFAEWVQAEDNLFDQDNDLPTE